MAQLPENSAVVLFSADEFPRNGDQFFPFRQQSDLFYLTGIDQEETTLVMLNTLTSVDPSTMLFIKKTDINQITWFGKKLNQEKAKEISGISEVLFQNRAQDVIKRALQNVKHIFVWQNEFAKFETPVPYANLRKAEELKKNFPKAKFHSLFPLMEKLRLIKSEEEIAQMKKAVDITSKAYHRVLKALKSGMMEYEIEAEISYEFLKNGAAGHAYAPIIAGGENACILHYPDNDKELNEGDLLLMDFGAEYGNYAADCSRTIPVSGKFNPRQRTCYEAVLRVFNKAKTLFVPGNTIDIINKEVGGWMQNELIGLGLLTEEEIKKHDGENPPYFKYFMHGTSHFIGLDVHDVGSKQTPFQKGMVLTCEPGIYIPEEKLGIRIETDIVVDDKPIDLMEDFPVTVEEIELAMR